LGGTHRIPIGVPTDASFTNFAFGNFTLAIVRPNVTIECNGCTLSGGYAQLATIRSLPSFGLPSVDASGLIVRGVRFTGTIRDLAPSVRGTSLALGVGHDILIENCTFEHLQLTSKVVTVGRLGGVDVAVPLKSVSVTIRNSVFSDITIGPQVTPTTFLEPYYPVIWSAGQTVSIERTKFVDCEGLGALSCRFSDCIVEDSCFINMKSYRLVEQVTETAEQTSSLSMKRLYKEGWELLEAVPDRPAPVCEEGFLKNLAVEQGKPNGCYNEFRFPSCNA